LQKGNQKKKILSKAKQRRKEKLTTGGTRAGPDLLADQLAVRVCASFDLEALTQPSGREAGEVAPLLEGSLFNLSSVGYSGCIARAAYVCVDVPIDDSISYAYFLP